MTEVHVNQTTVLVETSFSNPEVVTLISAGPVGPAGPPGPLGSASKHDFLSPASTWTIIHGKTYFPMVEVYDTFGNRILCDTYVDGSVVVLTFATPSTGFVLLV